jgi:hypothetical protein
MSTLRIYDFDGVLIPDGKNHNNVIIREVNKGSYPKGASNSSQAFGLLRENPIGNEARVWIDDVFLKQGVRFVKSKAFEDTLDNTLEEDGTSIIISASAFEGVINYMVEKAGLIHVIPPENVFTVSNTDQSLIPGLKADKAKDVAEKLEYTNIVFLDDNIRNVNGVAELDGVAMINGQLSVTAIVVNKMLGLEDAEVLEKARWIELEYNINDALKQENRQGLSNSSEDPVYMNNHEAITAAEAAAELDPVYMNNREAVAAAAELNPIYANNPGAMETAVGLDPVYMNNPKAVQIASVLTKQIEQSELAVNFAKAATKTNPLYKDNLKAAQDVLSKLKNSVEQHPQQAGGKSNPLLKAAQGILSKFKNKSEQDHLKVKVTSKQKPVKEKLDSSQMKRRATLKSIKSQAVAVEISVQDLVAQLQPDSPVLKNNEDASKKDLFAELKVVLPVLKNNEDRSARADLSKLTGASIELTRKPPILLKDMQNPKGPEQEKPKVGPQTKPKPAVPKFK